MWRRTELRNQLLELNEVELLFGTRGTHCCKFVRSALQKKMGISLLKEREQHKYYVRTVGKGYGYR